MFVLYANKNQLTVRKKEPVTSGSVNVYTARFEFSPDWAGLTRKAVFKAGKESRTVLLDESGECAIPWEVLTSHGQPLTAGIFGMADETALPTTWANLGIILEGVPGDGEGSKSPAPDLWEQELTRKGDGLEYDGINLTLMSGDKALSTVQIAGGEEGDVPVPGPQGLPGERGEPGPGVSPGGSVNQILTKASVIDYDTKWIDRPAAVTPEQMEEALADKQPKLTGRPGSAVGFGEDGSAVAVPGWSNPNLLDNWYFADPINQRGQMEYSGIGYTIDRWVLQEDTGKLVLNSNGVTLSGSAENNHYLLQKMESDLFDKVITYSILLSDGKLYSKTGALSRTIGDDVYIDFDIGQIGFHVYPGYLFGVFIASRPGQSITPVAAKLELGSQQTLAHQDADGNWVLNDPPPNKALELAKCQRYYVNVGKSPLGLIASGIYFPRYGVVTASIPVPVSMRAKPVVVNVESYGHVYQNGVIVDAQDAIVDDQESGSVRILFSGVSHAQWEEGPASIDTVRFGLSADL